MAEIKKADVARLLFYKQYPCDVPEMFFHSMSRIVERGVPSTGDKQFDKELMSLPRRVSFTIPQMSDYLEQGASIALVHPNDSVEIYSLIQQHVANWAWIIRTQFNFRPPPAEDFECLQRLADAFSYSVNVLNQGRQILAQDVKSIKAFTTKGAQQSLPKVYTSPTTLISDADWRRR